MKNLLLLLLFLLCSAVLLMGQLHWKDKAVISVQESTVSASEPSGNLKENTNQQDDYLLYTSNWPKDAVLQFSKTLEEGREFRILMVGSPALMSEQGGWPTVLQEELKQTYGDTVTVSVKEYNLNSMQFVAQGKVGDMLEQKPDFIIWEPFTLLDNGVVSIDDSLANIQQVIESLKEANRDVVIALQPPHPIFNATFYPVQVNELQRFAVENGLFYINHWEAWPDQTSEEIKQYLVEDQTAPNNNGHQVWADYLKNILISEKP